METLEKITYNIIEMPSKVLSEHGDEIVTKRFADIILVLWFPYNKTCVCKDKELQRKIFIEALHAINWKLNQNKYIYYMTMAII